MSKVKTSLPSRVWVTPITEYAGNSLACTLLFRGMFVSSHCHASVINVKVDSKFLSQGSQGWQPCCPGIEKVSSLSWGSVINKGHTRRTVEVPRVYNKVREELRKTRIVMEMYICHGNVYLLSIATAEVFQSHTLYELLWSKLHCRQSRRIPLIVKCPSIVQFNHSQVE